MKPPICELCNIRFDPGAGVTAGLGGGALVAFAVDDETRNFDGRSEQPGFVGHRPNRGWFCPDHVATANEHIDMSLPNALATLRRSLAETAVETETEQAGLRAPPVFRRQRRVDAETGLVEAELAVDINVFEFHERLREFRPTLVAVLGLPDGDELATRRSRTWNPMDGAREPDCPYTDRVVDEAELDGIEQGIEIESNWWNPSSLSNASARLFILDRPSPSNWATHVVRITGSTGHLTGASVSSAPVHTLSVTHLADSAVEACIAAFARDVSASPSAS